MRKMWNRVQVVICGVLIFVVLFVVISASLPWRICKAVVEAAMDWATYDVPEFSVGGRKIARAFRAGIAPMWKRWIV